MTTFTSLNIPELAARLQLQRKSVLSDVRQHLHRSGESDMLELANHLDEVDDWTAADLLNATDIAQLIHEVATLRDIDAALGRIKSGSYGVCKGCDEPISLERMSAQPTAEFCLPCQQAFEKRHGLGHGASL